MPLEKRTYIEALRRETTAFADAVDGNFSADVPCCPGWTVSSLTGHLGAVFAGRAKIVKARSSEPLHLEEEDIAHLPGYIEWFDSDCDLNKLPAANVADWYREQATALVDGLNEVEPDTPMWTWWDPEQNAGFWMRRMAQEAAVHRWDAQSARAAPQAIDPDLASDGVDEYLDIFMPSNREEQEHAEGNGESFHFHRTDGDGEWLVRFDGDSVETTRGHGKGDVAIRGSASDLLLFLWGRIPGEKLDVVGDRSLLPRWFQLVPAD